MSIATGATKTALFALAASLCMLPHGVSARSLDIIDLIEEEKRQNEERRLEDQKLERFTDPELFALLRSTANALYSEDFAAAEASARSLLDRAPASPQGYHMLGLALANQGRVDEAIEALDRAAAIFEVNAGPLIVKADLLLARGDMSGARAAFALAAERDPEDWRAHDGLGRLAIATQDAEAALVQYRLAAETAPPSLFEPRARLAALLAEAERLDEARAVLSAFADGNPDQPEPLVALGRLAFSFGEEDAATGFFDAAIGLVPDDPQLRLFKARAQLNATRFAEAETTLREAIAAFPDDAALVLELGGLQGLTQDYASALETFAAGARRWPDVAGFHAGASRAAYRIDDFSTALTHAEALAVRDAATASDHFWHAVVLERLERTDAAMAAYETAIAGDGSNWIALNNLASLITAADPDRAVALTRRAADLSGGNAQVRTTLGWALHASGASAEALALLRELASDDPANAAIAYRLGRVLLDTGEAEAGRAELARALEIDPTFRHAENARRLLAAQ